MFASGLHPPALTPVWPSEAGIMVGGIFGGLPSPGQGSREAPDLGRIGILRCNFAAILIFIESDR